MTGSVGLRERKKAAARQALHEAALHLAAERGFDRVTTEAIADAAGMSRRTFSNYFTGKEEAVLYTDEQHLSRLLEFVRCRPATESGWHALRAGLADLDREFGAPARDRVAAMRLLRQHPALLARQAAFYTAFEQDLVGAIAGRDLGGVSARVLAAAFLGALRLGTLLWLADPGGGQLGASIERVLDETARPFA